MIMFKRDLLSSLLMISMFEEEILLNWIRVFERLLANNLSLSAPKKSFVPSKLPFSAGNGMLEL